MEHQLSGQLPEKIMVVSLSDVERAAFYRKTYTHVAGGVLVFVLFEYLLLQNETIVEFMLSMTEGYKWLLKHQETTKKSNRCQNKTIQNIFSPSR